MTTYQGSFFLTQVFAASLDIHSLGSGLSLTLFGKKGQQSGVSSGVPSKCWLAYESLGQSASTALSTCKSLVAFIWSGVASRCYDEKVCSVWIGFKWYLYSMRNQQWQKRSSRFLLPLLMPLCIPWGQKPALMESRQLHETRFKLQWTVWIERQQNLPFIFWHKTPCALNYFWGYWVESWAWVRSVVGK